MISIASSIATLGLTATLLTIAGVKAPGTTSVFYWSTALIILLWSQPWSSRDFYRSDQPIIRWVTYLLLALLILILAVIFPAGANWLILIEVIVLGTFETFGWLTSRRSRDQSLL